MLTLVALVVSCTPASAASSGKAPAAVPSSNDIFGYIKGLTSHGYRRTGSAADRWAVEYMVRHFQQFGLRDVHIQTVRSYWWAAERWGLTVGGRPIPSFPVPHSFISHRGRPATFSTGPNGRTAQLVDVGDGSAETFGHLDVRGKIVLFNVDFLTYPISLFKAVSLFFYDPGQTLKPNQPVANPYLTNITDVVDRAVRGGAVGFVGVLADYFNSNHYFNEDIGLMPIPGLWITRAAGARVRAAIAATPGATHATLRLDGQQKAVTGRSAIGLLPGRSKQTILIESHHDSVFTGATEDGSGAAEILALAKYFGAMPASSRSKTLMFASFDTHFTGYQAHKKFIADYIRKHPGGRRIVADVTVEHIARHADIVDGKLKLSNLPEPRGIFENTSRDVLSLIKQAIIGNHLIRTVVLPTNVIGVPTDASYFYDAGVPIISLISGPIYLYDPADTLDKVQKNDLQPVAKAFAQIVKGLQRLPSAKIPAPKT